MSLILALALLGQSPSPDDVVSRSLPPDVRKACIEWNRREAKEAAERRRRLTPRPIPMAELERRAWIGWLGTRYGFGKRQPQCTETR